MFPKNDNDRNETQNVANDNGGDKTPRPTSLGELYAPKRVDLMLALAGYDPEKIPEADRQDALHTAWCFEKGIFDARSISEATDIGRGKVRKLVDHLRFAAKPGTKVG
jgi:hypothetical protein